MRTTARTGERLVGQTAALLQVERAEHAACADHPHELRVPKVIAPRRAVVELQSGGWGSPLAHRHRDWAHPGLICTRTGLTPCHICTGTRLTPAMAQMSNAGPCVSRLACGPPSSGFRCAAAATNSHLAAASGTCSRALGTV